VISNFLSIAAIAGFSYQLLKLGSDLTETQSKFDVVFGTIAEQVNSDVENMADTLGRSKLELKGYVATLGAMLEPLLGSKEATAELSKEIVKLGVDLASFNNVSDEQAINALTRGLLGEREALKSLGISILEAEVSQKAYQL
jgi:hypothetical protein